MIAWKQDLSRVLSVEEFQDANALLRIDLDEEPMPDLEHLETCFRERVFAFHSEKLTEDDLENVSTARVEKLLEKMGKL